MLLRTRVERAHVKQPGDVALNACVDELLNQFYMNGVEFPASATFLVEDANKVDHRITALDTCMKLGHIMHVGLDDLRARQHQQFPGTFTPAGYDPESMTPSSKLRTQVAANKTGSAQYTDR